MKLESYLKRMSDVYEIATKSIDNGASKLGYIAGYLYGALDGIKSAAMYDDDIVIGDYEILIVKARNYKEDLEKYESKSV